MQDPGCRLPVQSQRRFRVFSRVPRQRRRPAATTAAVRFTQTSVCTLCGCQELAASGSAGIQTQEEKPHKIGWGGCLIQVVIPVRSDSVRLESSAVCVFRLVAAFVVVVIFFLVLFLLSADRGRWAVAPLKSSNSWRLFEGAFSACR